MPPPPPPAEDGIPFPQKDTTFPRPVAAAALSPAMPLCGETGSRHPDSGRQPTGDFRPSSSGEKSRKGRPLPGFRLRRKELKSFFPAACTSGKILLTE